MKARILLAVFTGLIAACPRSAFASSAPRALVAFDHPEKFTDVADLYPPTDQGRDYILKTLSDFLVNEAGRLVPAGCKLSMTFTDIDLAGAFEPWRGPQFDDIRIVKDIYPPRFKFSYMLTDAAGRVLLQGRENLLDLNFQNRLVLDRQDPLCYEKDILKDWMRGHLRGVQALAAGTGL